MINEEVLAKIKPGATVKVTEKIKEKDKERLGIFSGIVLARKHGKSASSSITVRAELAGVGVEKVYPLSSPAISKIEVLSTPKKLKRAKLYYLRNLSKKRTRQQLGLSE